MRGVVAYVIDPEGEYASMARAAGGRVISPGVAGQGLNPFVIDRRDDEELLQRIGSLRRLIEVMVGERLGAERRAALDHALAGYYAEPSEGAGFASFYRYLQESDADLAKLLRPFATGSLRHLLSDEGDDLLAKEALVTVFDLHLLEPELRPAAAMVCTETVWAAAARDPKPRLLVVDEVWSIMQHPEGEYASMARAAGGRVISPGVPGQGLNPFVIDRRDDEELLQRIGSLRRLIEVMVGERLGAERRAALDHALASYYAEPSEGAGFASFYRYLQESDADLAKLLRPFATGSLRHLLSDEGDDLLAKEALVTVFDLHLLEPELRPAAAMVCTETVWAAAARDPKPRLLVVDEVWSIMQHPEGAAFMVSVAKRARKHRLGLQFITQDVQDLLSEDSSRTITGHSGRALLQNAAFKLLLQQDAAAISTVGDAFDLPPDLQRWLLSCQRGDGLLLARGNRFPIRIEATPEEQALIEWRPGAQD